MKILIIEDEIPATKRLISLIQEIEPSVEILDTIDEVSTAVNWLNTQPSPDLIFMDVQLADGYSFEIFEKTTVNAPVIFATAFDQYAVNAFRVNGLDYLLKPIQKADLEQSIDRFRARVQKQEIDIDMISALIRRKEKAFKERFLIKSGEELNFVRTSEVAYFLSESSYSFVVTKSGNRYILDETMEQIERAVDPDIFFRINRKQLVSLDSIHKIASYFNHRLKLELTPSEKEDVIVSRSRVKEFKEWLNK